MKAIRKLFFILALLIFQNCQNEKITINTDSDSGILTKVSATKEDKLLKGFEYLKAIIPTNGIRISKTLVENLMLDSALRRFDQVTRSTNYSIFLSKNLPKTLTNLVITENNGSYLAFIVDYISDTPSKGWDLNNFHGKMILTSVSGKDQREILINPLANSASNRVNGLICTTFTVQVNVSSPYGINTYYETEISCFYAGGASTSSEPLGYYVYQPGNDLEVFPGRTGINGGGGTAESYSYDLDQTIGHLCSNLKFQQVGRSFTAQISGLGVTAINALTNSVIHAELGTNCIEIPDYFVRDKFQASDLFTNAFNNAREEIPALLNSGLLAPNSIDIRNKLKSLVLEFLNLSNPGSTLSTGVCSGDVVQNTADYGC